MEDKSKKPQLTKAEIEKVQWLNNPKKKDAVRIGRFQKYWILSQNDKASPYLVYDQTEWDAFISGVKEHEFDDLTKG